MVDESADAWIYRPSNSNAAQMTLSVAETPGRWSVRIMNLLLLPGVVARVGIRQCSALLLGVRVVHIGFSKAPGGHVVVDDSAARWKRLLIVVGAPLVLLPLGAALSSQLIVDQVTLQSFVPVPATFDAEGYATAFLDTSVRFDGVDLVRLWFTISCWYMLVIPYKDVMSVLHRSETSPEDGPGKLRWYARPVAVAAWLAAQAGPLAGVLAIFLAYWIAGRTIRVLVQRSLGL